jgi:dethiobiotin synthetase
MKSLFITATDTGAGKTTFSAALLTQARARGINAAPMKPVQTGCSRRDSRLVAPDLEFCLSAAGLNASDELQDLMSPYRFEPACSPHLAAREAGVSIELEKILDACHQLHSRHDVLIVEGAGGILVPLNEHHFMLDLMKAMKLPIVLVARAGLGTLNHTLLSLHELQRAGLMMKGIVLVDSSGHDPADIVEDNFETIKKAAGHLPIIRMPFFQSLDKNVRSFSRDWKIPDEFFQ